MHSAHLISPKLSLAHCFLGGGLVFPQTVRQKTTYILRGIVSTGGNKDGSCDSDKYTTFTNVAFHMDFVNTHITKYDPKY